MASTTKRRAPFDWPNGQSLAPLISERVGHPIDDSLFVADRRGGLYALDAQGRRLWDAIESGASLEDLVGAAVRDGGQSAEAARDSIARIIESWNEAGLIGEHAPESNGDAGSTLPLRRPGPDDLDLDCQLGETVVRLRCQVPSLAPILAATCAPLRRSGAAAPPAEIVIWEREGHFAVHCSTSQIRPSPGDGATTSNPRQARHWCLTGLIETSLLPRRLVAILHAAAVGNQQGGCVILPGSGGSGKSTLAAALVASGSLLVSDDYVPLEADSLLAWPVPYPLSIKQGSWAIVGRYFASLPELPTFAIGDVIIRLLMPRATAIAARDVGRPVQAIVFPNRVEGAKAKLRRLDATEGLIRLCQARAIIDHSADRLRQTVRWIQRVPCYTLTYGDLDQAVSRVQSVLDAG